MQHKDMKLYKFGPYIKVHISCENLIFMFSEEENTM